MPSLTPVTTWLDRLNQRHPWSHNDRLAPWVVRRVAASGARDVLDVGCGTGNLVARLHRRVGEVSGLEPDPASAARARARFADVPGVTVTEAGFAERDPDRRWDAVTLVAVLHHMPLEATLRELRAALSPGGRLVVVGCHRDEGWADHLTALVSVVLNPLVGLVRHPAAVTEPPPHMRAPTLEPQWTLGRIRAAVAQELPGARVRRRLFWRHTLVYDHPS
ncbi:MULTISPECIES: bifunctional 2-polyprenyl-6-hydroxyphenol methylase/3-demethylubiquinol 3-O-methyltransferase UbiG [unclassified Nocardiopsis]|uniref:class I SAM-dependent methyltransferase n=1 Tax=unclassified Nocardiopsis TaxID=2649073 RepID=UPI00066BFA3D|nr:MULTISPECIES: class I SAM-dependent methyltransferase [unclassified Nocardiopsis]MBQ1079876.1 class I SAM-dependent methyltransferase [Nocardiopsis sp. B62]